MLPPLGESVWKKLLTGEAQLKSSNLAINMLLTNSRMRYKLDPSKAQDILAHVHEVFSRYEKTLAAELDQLADRGKDNA